MIIESMKEVRGDEIQNKSKNLSEREVGIKNEIGENFTNENE
jgi:hypothetical protein